MTESIAGILVGSAQSSVILMLAAGLGAAFALGAAAVIHSVRQLIFGRGIEAPEKWLEEFDADQYQKMLRLFDPDDFDFLRYQPEYTPKLERRLRRDRVEMARSYLTSLQRDVRLLLNQASAVARDASDDAADFSAFVMKQEAAFAVSFVSLHFQLVLMRHGLRHSIDFSRVLGDFQSTFAQTRMLAVPA